MQKCESCGAYFSDFDKACPHCGWTAEPEVKTEPEKIPEPEEKREEIPQTNPGTAWQPRSGGVGSFIVPPAVDSPYPMKWHKFLMFVMLLGPAFSIYNEITTLMNPADMLDIVFALLGIGAALFAFYVRNRLFNYRKDGPNLLTVLYAVTAVVNIAYALSLRTVAQGEEVDYIINTTVTGEIIGSLVMILVNRKYYGRRKELFVN